MRLLEVTVHNYPAEGAALSEIADLLRAIKAQGEEVMANLDELKAQVAANTTVVQSAVTLIHGLANALEAAKDDPEEVQAIVDELKATDAALATAVAANTPGTPAPAPDAPAPDAPAPPSEPTE